MMILKKILPLMLLIIYTPLVSAASIFTNVAFDVVLLLIVAFVIFQIIRKMLK